MEEKQVIKQPFPNVCGQTCVAAITGDDVDAVIAEVGRHGTHAYHLRAALAKRGWKMAERSVPLKGVGLPGFPCLILCRYIENRRLRAHWMWFDGKDVWDPGSGCSMGGVPPDWTAGCFKVEKTAC